MGIIEVIKGIFGRKKPVKQVPENTTLRQDYPWMPDNKFTKTRTVYQVQKKCLMCEQVRADKWSTCVTPVYFLLTKMPVRLLSEEFVEKCPNCKLTTKSRIISIDLDKVTFEEGSYEFLKIG